MSEQPRDPAGSGQYATKPLDEVNATLHAVPQGSYLFPDFMRSADEVVAFYDNVEIPDEVCMKTASNFVAARESAADIYPDFYWEKREQPHRARTGGDTSDAARAEFIADYEVTLRNLPEALDPRDARTAAKAIAMTTAALELSDDDIEAVNAAPLMTSTGPSTVRQVFRDWGLGTISRKVLDPESYRDTTEVTTEHLNHLLGALKHELRMTKEGIDTSLRQTGEAIIDAI